MATKDFKVKNGLSVGEGISVDSGSIIVAGIEVINSSGNVVGVYQGFDSDFSVSILNTTTDSLSEGLNNLYYTRTRFDSDLSTKSTSDLVEGSNLYYTQNRFDSAFDVRLSLKTTSDITEGSNLYYTDNRVLSYLSTNSYATLSNIDSAIAALVAAAPSQLDTLNELAAAINNDSNFAGSITALIGEKVAKNEFSTYFDSNFALKSTSDLVEGSNLYYTQGRFDSALSTKTTDNLTEGSNLYYTSSRVDSDILGLVDSSYIENRRPAETIFNVVNNGTTAYSFTGDGFPTSSDNPVLYLQKGLTYKFKINSPSHPFEIRVSNGGSAYSDGVINNSIGSGDIYFTVPMDAPSTLYYQCTIHSSMVGTIYITEAASITSDEITEGSNNLYYTSSRVDSDILSLVDSAYIQARQVDIYRDSAFVTGIVDATYINSLVTATDSTAVITLITDTIDSAYVQARQIVGGGSGTVDSAQTISLITGTVDSNYVSNLFPVGGSSTIIMPVAYAHITLNNYTANSGIGLSWGTYQYSAGNYAYYQFTFDTPQPDTNYAVLTDMVIAGDTNISPEVTNRTTSGFRLNFYDNNGTELNVGSVATYEPIIQVYSSTPTKRIAGILSDSIIDSSGVINLIDSAYIQARQIIGGGSGTVDSAQTIALITDTVDSAYIAARGGIYYLDEFSVSEYKFTADSNQTIFTGTDDNGNTLAFNSSNYQVYVNGVKITTSDYTANSLTDTITLVDPASFEDEILVTVYNREQGATNVTLVDSAWLTNLVSTVYAGSASVETYFFTADSGQSLFAGIDDNGQTLSYSSGSIQVFVNGVAIVDGIDFTATNGSSITLDIPADSGDQILINDFGALYSTNLGLDSSAIITLIDSAYIQARQIVGGGGAGTVDSAQTISLITDTVDSAYIQARSSGGIQYITVDHYFENYKFISDSGQTIFSGSDFNGNVLAFDSSEFQIYINGIRITDVDFAANPITDTVTLTTGTLQNDEVVITTLKVKPGSEVSLGIDSAQTIVLITDTIDSAYINARVDAGGSGTVDSAQTINLITDIVDSNYVQSRAILPVNTGIATVGFYRFTATAGQTIFSGTDVNGNLLQYEIGSVLVYYNGSLIAEGADFTATTGGSITLLQGAVAGDDIFIVNYRQTFYGGGAAPGYLVENFYYTATAGQLSFSGTDDLGATLNYKPGNIQVFLNGFILRETIDYTAINGTTITLTSAAGLNDELTISKISQSGFNGSYWREVSNNYTAAAGQRLIVDTSTNSIQISLPAVATLGDEIRIVDGSGNAANNNITILHNGHKIQGGDSDLTVDVNEAAFGLVYYNTTRGWILTEK